MKTSFNVFPRINIIVLLLITATLIFSCSAKKEFTYFDVDNTQISKMQFQEKRATNKYFDLTSDSLNYKKLIERYETGKIENVRTYQSLILNRSEKKLDLSKPLVIIYHPGKDRCNSSGAASKKTLARWYSELEKGIVELNANAPIYLYKEKEGLEKYEDIISYYKDPEGLTEKLFFKYHYPVPVLWLSPLPGNIILTLGNLVKTGCGMQ